jgi:hypothetical protein
MKKIIILIIIVLIFASLIPGQFQPGIGNSLSAYFLYTFAFVVQNYFIFFLGGIVLILIFFRNVRFDRNYSLKKNYLLSAFQLINLLVISFFLSYIALLFVAFIQLNIFAILININPKILGIVTDKKTVISTIKKNNYPPKIVTGSDERNIELTKIAGAITGTNSLYGYYILPSVPGFFVLPIKNSGSSLLLIDNTLIITRLNSGDLQNISPIVSYLLIQQYFPDRKIRAYPKISIMNKAQYQKHRTDEFREGLATINENIEKYKILAASDSAFIREDNAMLSYNKSLVDKSISEYKTCLADGDYSLIYCKDLLSTLRKSQLGDKEIAGLNNKLESDRNRLKEDEEYQKFYEGLVNNLHLAEGSIPQEFGAFTPPDTISVAFNTSDSSHTIADYLETLVHEYLHYASYITDNQRLTDSFFEEGLTEYFARQVIKDNLNVSTNLGYPVSAKIFGQMTNRILERDIADAYFSKDQNGLEKLLDRVYGDNFYKDSRIQFLNLQYSSSKERTLLFANEIMKKIGGDPLKEKDLLSTHVK